MTDPNEACIALFQRRRQRTWHAMRAWILIGAIGLGVTLLFGPAESGPIEQFNPPILFAASGMLAFMASIGFIVFAVQKHYRCPRCNSVPMAGSAFVGTSGIGYRRGVSISPKVCPKCKAPLT